MYLEWIILIFPRLPCNGQHLVNETLPGTKLSWLSSLGLRYNMLYKIGLINGDGLLLPYTACPPGNREEEVIFTNYALPLDGLRSMFS